MSVAARSLSVLAHRPSLRMNGDLVGANQYRGELARKRQQHVAAQKKAGEFRVKEAAKRSDAMKARTAASKSNSASTVASKLREVDRREDEANSAGKEAGRWQTKAAGYAKDEASIQVKLARAEQSEAATAERKRVTQARREVQSANAQHSMITSRLDDHDEQLSVVVRELRAPKPERLRVLMLAASAEGDLRVGREAKRIRAAIQSALGRDLIELDVRTSATTDDLLDGLTGFRPHVIHFSGHSDEDLVVFDNDVDDFNEGVVVDANVFARALRATDDPPLLVVLNSCNSAVQAARLVESVVPFAIGMSEEIDDGDAIVYAAKFYAAVADGQSIEAADRVGRVALELAGLPGHDLPTLASAADVDPAATWLVELANS